MPRIPLRRLPGLLVQTAKDWNDDKASTLAAALSFYTALSLAPLVVIVVGIIGLAYGEDTARREILGQVHALLGTQGAQTVKAVLEESAKEPSSGVVATVVGFVILLFGASGVFGALQESLNTIYEVEPEPGRGLKGLIADRFLSFAMVLVVGFLLLVSLILSAALSALGERLGSGTLLWQGLNMVVSFGVISGLFALIFKMVPDVELRFRDVWFGAVVTAALFVLGKLGLGLYLAHGSVGSAYGAAGSLVAMLVWVYYSAQILFFGAELTQAYATAIGSRIRPSKNAVAVDGATRADLGLGPAKLGPAALRPAARGSREADRRDLRPS
jgi:membrane protein